MTTTSFTHLVEMQRHAVAQYGPKPVFGTKRDGAWVWTTYEEFGERVDAMRGGLAAQGIGKGDSVALISANRDEWAITAYATYGVGGKVVPMYEDQKEKDWRYILADSGARLLVTSHREIYERVADLTESLEKLEAVYCMELPEEDPQSMAALEATGRLNPVAAVDLAPEDLCGFIYTSGTTGEPKGVLLSHGNIMANVNPLRDLVPLSTSDCAVSFLPWAHSFGHTVELHISICVGSKVAFAESVPKLVDNIGEIRPTVLVSVPRIWNKVYDALHKRMAAEGGLKKKLFDAALANARERRRLAATGRRRAVVELKHAFFDRLVFSKVRARMGGRLQYAISGGAALSKEVAEFIDDIGIKVYEGWGLTETSPIATCNRPGEQRIGSVGRPLPGVRVEVDRSVLEDDSDDGELVVYGPIVMQGYHNLPEQTAAVMTDDGGFRTGDRGHIDDDGYVYITGRIKEQYKLENGKYVVPAPLEEQLQLSPYIVQVFIEGSNRPFNVALIVPDREALEGWAQGMDVDYAALLEEERANRLIADELDRLSSGFKGYERIRRFHLLGEEFSTDNGLLTPSLKIKRRAVVDRYDNLLQPLWTP